MYNLEKYNKTELSKIYHMLGTTYIYHAPTEIQMNYIIDIIKDDPETCYRIIRLRRLELSDDHTLIFLKGVLSDKKVYNKYVGNSKVIQESSFLDMKLIIETLPVKNLKRYVNTLIKNKFALELKDLVKCDFGKEKNDIIASLISLKVLEGD